MTTCPVSPRAEESRHSSDLTPALIHHHFQRQASRFPSRVAVECDGQCLTYQELNERANRLAHYLQRLGVGPDVGVGVCVDRSLELVIGFSAFSKPAVRTFRLSQAIRRPGRLFYLTRPNHQ